MHKVLLLSALFAVAQPGLHAQPAGIPAAPALSDAQAAGARIFQQKCAVCHLPILRSGDTPYASRLDGARAARDRDQARRVIEEGNAAGMPGWKHTLRPAQIDALLAYLDAFDGAAPPAADRAHGGSAPRVAPPGEKDALLTGTVTAASGEPLEGITVSARRRGGRSRRRCSRTNWARTSFPRWRAARTRYGRRRPAGRACGARSPWRGARQRQDFVLHETADFAAQLTGDQVGGRAAGGHAGPPPNESRLRRGVHRVSRCEHRAAQPLRRAGVGRGPCGNGPHRCHEHVPRAALAGHRALPRRSGGLPGRDARARPLADALRGAGAPARRQHVAGGVRIRPAAGCGRPCAEHREPLVARRSERLGRGLRPARRHGRSRRERLVHLQRTRERDADGGPGGYRHRPGDRFHVCPPRRPGGHQPWHHHGPRRRGLVQREPARARGAGQRTAGPHRSADRDAGSVHAARGHAGHVDPRGRRRAGQYLGGTPPPARSATTRRRARSPRSRHRRSPAARTGQPATGTATAGGRR